ncbi:hypothetical protein PROFUN_12131 [Planoprotostelium fungivorum]|uniref:Uncharacterized protein n=1 Tax=Planoprotostelium fungivorum TaxID=1890364 RepID=A0A2P6N899_9EUKA|nr:hypothetical protein PROFUN_12131 [Planoprotostelium fungivorum]
MSHIRAASISRNPTIWTNCNIETSGKDLCRTADSDVRDRGKQLSDEKDEEPKRTATLRRSSWHYVALSALFSHLILSFIRGLRGYKYLYPPCFLQRRRIKSLENRHQGSKNLKGIISRSQKTDHRERPDPHEIDVCIKQENQIDLDGVAEAGKRGEMKEGECNLENGIEVKMTGPEVEPRALKIINGFPKTVSGNSFRSLLECRFDQGALKEAYNKSPVESYNVPYVRVLARVFKMSTPASSTIPYATTM